MPELQNVVPSSEELREYLSQHVPGSVFSAFFMVPEQVVANFPRGAAQAFQSLRRLHGEAFAQLAFDSVLIGLERMNALPRDDRFWENTNHRPTIFKLQLFCDLERDRLADPEPVLWTAVFFHIWFGSNDFGQRFWLELSRRWPLDVRWPVYAALTIHLTASSTIGQLPDFLREAGLVDAAVPVIRTFAGEAEGDAVTWAEAVLANLQLHD